MPYFWSKMEEVPQSFRKLTSRDTTNQQPCHGLAYTGFQVQDIRESHKLKMHYYR